MKKRCLIIDDQDQSQEIKKMIRDGKAIHGIELECEQFNVGSTFFDEVLTEGKIDITKVVSEFKKKFNGQTFQLAAFDRDLNDPAIDGVELIRQLTHHKILRHTPKVLYSSDLEGLISESIDNFNKEQLIKRIKTLVNNDIKGYFERDSYENDILRTLANDEETLDLVIEEELKKFPALVFKNVFVHDDFKNKTYDEIAIKLEEYTHLRNDFKKEIIQQVIAYLTEKI